MGKIVLFGAGQIAEVAHFYFQHDSPHEVVAFTVDSAFVDGHQYRGLPLVAFEEVQENYPPDDFDMFLSISYRNVNQFRMSKYEQAKQKGYKLISYVSSRAITWPGAQFGDNAFVLESNVIQPFV